MQQSQRHYTLDDYFFVEEGSPLRYEYFRGEILAMAAGTLDNAIEANVFGHFFNSLSGSHCRVFTSNQRIAAPSGLYTYPDVSIVCGPPELTNERLQSLLNPVVLVEVLSDSTRDYDRGEKFELYRSIPTLREYLLVEQSRVHVERRYRTPDGEWKSEVKESLGDSLVLSAVEVELPLARVYENLPG